MRGNWTFKDDTNLTLKYDEIIKTNLNSKDTLELAGKVSFLRYTL